MKTDCKKIKLIKNFNENKLEKRDLKILPLIEELRGSWFDVKKVTTIRVDRKQKLCWQEQKSLSKPVAAGIASPADILRGVVGKERVMHP